MSPLRTAAILAAFLLAGWKPAVPSRSPGRDTATETEPVIAHQTVFHDALHTPQLTSQLILPIETPRDESCANLTQQVFHT